MKKGLRFIFFASALIFLIGCLATFSWLGLQLIEKENLISKLADNIMPSVSNVVEVQSQTNLLRALQAQVLISKSDEKNKIIEEIESTVNSLTIYKKQIEQSVSELAQPDKFNSDWEQLIALNDEFTKFIKTEKYNTSIATEIFKKIDTKHHEISAHLKSISDKNFEKGTSEAHAIIKKSENF